MKKINDLKIKYENGVIIDRSPICDIIYDILFKVINLPFEEAIVKGKSYLDNYFNIGVFKEIFMCSTDKFLFIVPSDNMYNSILCQMKLRNNSLDIYELKFVILQVELFLHLKTYDFENITVMTILSSLKYLSEDYFDYLYDFVSSYFKKSFSKIEKDSSSCICYLESPLEKAFLSDAGLDLHLKDNYLCLAGVPIRIYYKEKIIISEGSFAYIMARGSTNSFGQIRSGVIDAHFTGDLFSYFVADKDCLLLKDSSVSQLLLHNVKKPIYFDKKDYIASNLNRNENCLGSSSAVKPYVLPRAFNEMLLEKDLYNEEYFRRWQSQRKVVEFDNLYNIETALYHFLNDAE